MKLALVDVDEEGLQQTTKEVSSVVGASNVLATLIDVADLNEVIKLKEKVFEAWDEVQPHIFFRIQIFIRWSACPLTGRGSD
jgi:predicted transcriptional regulator